MAHKHQIRTAISCLSFLLAAYCAAAGESSRKTLYIYTWHDYFDSEVISMFEQRFDCRVEMAYFVSNEDMHESIMEDGGSYDIVTPSSYMSSILFKAGLLHPLDHAKLPNLDNLDQASIPESEDPEHAYSIPYTVSISGVLYDKRLVSEADIGGWGIFSNPRYFERMTLIDDVRETMGAALKYLGFSLNTRNSDELARAGKTLAIWRDNVSSILGDDETLELNAASRIISHAYNGDAALAISEDENADFYVPREGASQTSDDFVIMGGTESPDLAHAFINFLLAPDIAARNMEGIFFYMPNAPALRQVSPELKSNPAFNLSPESIMRCEAIRDLGNFNAEYRAVWDEVFGGEG